jgi:small subunit ribosomal protein S19e
MKPNTGVGRLRKTFGGMNRGGHNQEHFGRATGQIIRTILHQLEAMKVVEKTDGSG